MSNNKPETKDTSMLPNSTPVTGSGRLTVRNGVLLVRYIGGLAEGFNEVVGRVSDGSIHTVSLEEAVDLCLRAAPQFELAYPDDRTKVEAAAKAARDAADRVEKAKAT